MAEISERQAAVAVLAQVAIRERDLDRVLDAAATLAASTLGTGRCLIWQLRPEHDDLIVRVQVGWRDLPAEATVPLAGGSVPGYVVRHDAPLGVEDLRADPRFEESWISREQAVVTMAGAVIRGRERPWGALSVSSLSARSFTDEDVEFLQSLAHVLALAIERHESEQAERREREALQTIFDNSPVMMSRYDAFGQLVGANPAWQQTLGWTIEEARQIDFVAQLHRDPDRLGRVRAFIGQADGRWEDFRLTTRGGQVVETTWARHRLSDGTTLGFGLDITERKRAEEAQAKALERLRAIASIADAALHRMALDDLLHELLSRLTQASNTAYGAVLLLDRQRENLVLLASSGFSVDRSVDFAIPVATSAAGAVVIAERAMMFTDIPAPDRDERRRWRTIGVDFASGMVAPLMVGDRVTGVVGVASIERRSFTEDELDLLQMVADRVAPAIERGRLIERIRAGSDRLEALSRRLLTVQEEERRRLALELHDQLGQIYTALQIKLGALQRRLGDDSARAQLADAAEMADLAVRTVRDLALDLRPAMLDDLGLPSALRWYADRFAKQTGLEIHLAIQNVPEVDAGVATTCFRVAQEALTNAARHARARNVWVDLRDDGALELAIRDDGEGFDVAAAFQRAARGASLGILGMQERVSLVSGDLSIDSRPGAGTFVRVRFPNGGAA